jgi:hypothetical protein
LNDDAVHAAGFVVRTVTSFIPDVDGLSRPLLFWQNKPSRSFAWFVLAAVAAAHEQRRLSCISASTYMTHHHSTLLTHCQVISDPCFNQPRRQSCRRWDRLVTFSRSQTCEIRVFKQGDPKAPAAWRRLFSGRPPELLWPLCCLYATMTTT